MGSTRRKITANSKITQLSELGRIDALIKKHTEDRNRLIYRISNNDVNQIETLHRWSLESFFQVLLANHLDAKKAEQASKTVKENSKLKTKKM